MRQSPSLHLTVDVIVPREVGDLRGFKVCTAARGRSRGRVLQELPGLGEIGSNPSRVVAINLFQLPEEGELPLVIRPGLVPAVHNVLLAMSHENLEQADLLLVEQGCRDLRLQRVGQGGHRGGIVDGAAQPINPAPSAAWTT